MKVPIDSIRRIETVLGERCRVVMKTTKDGRTLTITTEKGHIYSFTGQMDFTWIPAE